MEEPSQRWLQGGLWEWDEGRHGAGSGLLWDLWVPLAMRNSSLHRNTSPSLMSHLSPSPSHRGRRQGQSTFLAVEGKHNPKMQMLSFAVKQLAGPFVNGFLL